MMPLRMHPPAPACRQWPSAARPHSCRRCARRGTRPACRGTAPRSGPTAPLPRPARPTPAGRRCRR
ncbi:MAG: hypothetical protein E6I69_14040, partial [Chloroflexi bacterium]